MAKCSSENHDLAHAIQMQAKSAAILEDLSNTLPGNALLREYLGEAINRLGGYRTEDGDSAGGLESHRRAHQIFGELVAADPKNTLAKANFAFSDTGIARGLMGMGKLDAAVKVFRESIVTFEELSPQTTSNRYVRSGLVDDYWGLGKAYATLASGQNIPQSQRREYWEESRSSCQKSLALWNDKEKRGELESGEREQSVPVAQCVARSEAHLRDAGAK